MSIPWINREGKNDSRRKSRWISQRSLAGSNAISCPFNRIVANLDLKVHEFLKCITQKVGMIKIYLHSIHQQMSRTKNGRKLEHYKRIVAKNLEYFTIAFFFLHVLHMLP
jgi:hypothetical protein